MQLSVGWFGPISGYVLPCLQPLAQMKHSMLRIQLFCRDAFNVSAATRSDAAFYAVARLVNRIYVAVSAVSHAVAAF